MRPARRLYQHLSYDRAPARVVRHPLVRLERGIVLVNLVEEEVVRILVVRHDIEAQATRLVATRIGAIVQGCREKLLTHIRFYFQRDHDGIPELPPLRGT